MTSGILADSIAQPRQGIVRIAGCVIPPFHRRDAEAHSGSGEGVFVELGGHTPQFVTELSLARRRGE